MDKVICICGAVYRSCNTVRHLKGRKHINYLNDPMKVHIIKQRSNVVLNTILLIKCEKMHMNAVINIERI